MIRRTQLCLILLFLSLGQFAVAQDSLLCEVSDPQSTEYSDMNDPSSTAHVKMMETYHFSRDVEHLIKGLSAPLPFDIAFILNHVPNHYRALNAMAEWQLKNKFPDNRDNELLTADCYFHRAISYRPGDSYLRFVYGIYLHRAKRFADAQKVYDQAERMGVAGAELFYNRGLLELDMGNLAKASEYANRAYGMGYPLPGLRNKLTHARAEKNKTEK